MNKINKDLVLFFGLFFLLTAGIVNASNKFLPLLLQHTVYYCESFIQSISLHIPYEVGVAFVGILLFSLFVVFLKLVVSYLKIYFLRKKITAQVYQSKRFNAVVKKLGLEKHAFLIKNTQPFAFCFGIRSPKIYLSTKLVSMMNTTEVQAILLHEQYHLEHRDSLVLLLASLIKLVFPFFPLFTDFIRNYKIDREIEADQQSVLALGTSQPILCVLRKLLLCEPVHILDGAPAIADYDTLEIRIHQLVQDTPSKKFKRFNIINIVLSSFTLIVLFALGVAPVQAIEIHNQKQDVMMVCLQDDSCAAWCKENQSVRPFSPQVRVSHMP